MSFWHVLMGIEGGSPTAEATGFVDIAFSSLKATVTFSGGELMGCITRLSEMACEKSSYGVTVAFTDEDDTAMTPDTLTWSLRTTGGTIVNSRDGISLTPAETVTITLSGDDLQMLSGNNRRRLTIEGTYTSSLGSGIPLNAECEFSIGDLIGVS